MRATRLLNLTRGVSSSVSPLSCMNKFNHSCGILRLQNPIKSRGLTTHRKENENNHAKLDDSGVPRHPLRVRDQITQTRGLTASDISPTPTLTVRLSNLPSNTTSEDVRFSISSKDLAPKINFLKFEYNNHLMPLSSCRVTFFNTHDASMFLAHTHEQKYAGNTIKSDFVVKSVVPNVIQEKYTGGAFGCLVFLYGYPPYVNQYQIRDYFRSYDIIDTSVPGVQPAPLIGHTFLSRRGAFIIQFSNTSEAHRFVRDVYNTVYNGMTRSEYEPLETKDGAGAGAGMPSSTKVASRNVIRAIILQ